MTITASNWEVEISTSVYVEIADSRIAELLKYINDLQAATNIKEFEFIKQPSGKFNYYFKAFDDREFIQVIDITNHADYSMTFNTENEWKLSEMIPHRPLRSHVVKMAHEFQLDSIVINFIE